MVKKDSRNKREYERRQGQGGAAQNSVEKKGKGLNKMKIQVNLLRISKEFKRIPPSLSLRQTNVS